LPSVGVKSRQVTASGTRLIVASMAAACAAVLLALPQAVFPREGPGLALDPLAVREVVRREERLGPVSGAEVDRLAELYAAQGRAETSEGERREEFEARMQALTEAVAALRAAKGDEAIAALRAEALRALEPALAGALDPAEEQAVLGSFPRMLERYGAMRGGRLVAPFFVARTLYKARWNGIHRLPLTDGFAPIERQAYYGWLALHAHDAPATRRLAALEAYAEAGGAGAAEARAYFAALAGRPAEAAVRYGELWEQRGDLRARNHALALQGAGP